MGRIAAADSSQVRRSRLLRTLLLLVAAATAVLAIGDLLEFFTAIGAAEAVVRWGPAIAIPAALAITVVGALCFVRSPAAQRGLCMAALGSLALLPVVVIAWPPFTRAMPLAHGYQLCGRADPASRSPSNIWTIGDPARCDAPSR